MLESIRKKYIGDKFFYKRYIAIATPMIIQNAITNFVSFLDNIMVGRLGQEAISAVATVNQLYFVLAHYTALPILAVYFFVQGTEIVKSILGYFMVKSNVWLVQMV